MLNDLCVSLRRLLQLSVLVAICRVQVVLAFSDCTIFQIVQDELLHLHIAGLFRSLCLTLLLRCARDLRARLVATAVDDRLLKTSRCELQTWNVTELLAILIGAETIDQYARYHRRVELDFVREVDLISNRVEPHSAP